MIGSELSKGWKEVKLSDLAEIQSGGTPSRSNSAYWNGDIPWVKISDIKGKYVTETEEFITEEGLMNSSAKVFERGTILFSIFATIGKVAILDIDATTNQALVGLKINEFVDKSFLVYALIELSERISNLGKGVAQKNINISILKDVRIPLPPLTEQKQIAEKLDKLFDQIETIKEASNKIPELLKNFRQQVLTYAVTGKLIESTPEPRMLGELIDKLKYGTSKKADYDIEGFPVLRIPNINNGEIDSSDLKYVPLDDKEYNQLSLQEGDILVIRSNGSLSIVGQCAIVRKECENWVYAGYLIRIRCTHELLPEYLNYIFQSYQVRKQIVEKSHSMSGVNNFSADKIKQLEIAWYPVEVQKQIVDKLNSIFGKLNEIEKQYNTLCEKLEKLPQTLLCKAFKGELI